MPIALNPKRHKTYILECDRGTERPTVWKLKNLTAAEHAAIQDGIANVDQTAKRVHVTSGTTVIETLRLGLIGVEDFFDADGNPVKFTFKYSKQDQRDYVTMDFLDYLHAEWRDELARAIIDQNTVTEADSKN